MRWQPEPYLLAQEAMTPQERAAFLMHFTLANPHWKGAHVADVLSQLDAEDAHLDFVEPLGAEHRAEIIAATGPTSTGEARAAWQCFRLACYIAIWVHGPSVIGRYTALAWEAVRDFMERMVQRAGAAPEPPPR